MLVPHLQMKIGSWAAIMCLHLFFLCAVKYWSSTVCVLLFSILFASSLAWDTQGSEWAKTVLNNNTDCISVVDWAAPYTVVHSSWPDVLFFEIRIIMTISSIFSWHLYSDFEGSFDTSYDNLPWPNSNSNISNTNYKRCMLDLFK